MAYYDAISTLKSALDGYSAEEERLNALYKTAIENAEKAYSDELASLDKRYRADRRQAASDVARDERNAMTLLAERGLGFSGEAAQTKLNSNVVLANRLSELALGRAEEHQDLRNEHNADKHDLTLELNDKLMGLNDDKNGILETVAKTELERELQAEKLKAEKELQSQKLYHEKKLHQAELDAKYGGKSNTCTGNDVNLSINGSTGKDDESDILAGWTPEMKPKDLAKLIVANSTSDNYVKYDSEEYAINKYLLEMQESYKVDGEYMQELIFMLKAYGYEELEPQDMQVQVITRDAYDHYGAAYDESYIRFVSNGMSEADARSAAKDYAEEARFDFIYERAGKSIPLFRSCCETLGIPESDVEAYVKRKQIFDNRDNAASGFNPERGTANYLK